LACGPNSDPIEYWDRVSVMLHRPSRLLSIVSTLALAVGSNASAAGVTVNNMMATEGDEFWKNYTYISRDTVQSLNEAGSSLTEAGHHALNLDEAGSLARLGYAFTAGQINSRFQWANSLFFGHEGSHFQHAHRFGFNEHSFVSDDTGDEISYWDAYWRIFTKGEVGGPAQSSGSNVDWDLYASEGIEASLAGLNWQMGHSENWIRDAAEPGAKNAFDSTDFFLNRMYLTAYAYGDAQRYKKTGDQGGDVYKYAKHLTSATDAPDTLKDIAVYGLAASLLSPVFWQSAGAINEYVANGTTDFNMRFYPTNVGGVTWDIPQFMNKDAFTVAPTIYLNAAPSLSGSVGAEKLLVSASYETAVIGETDPEMRVTVTGNWGSLGADVGVSGNSEGRFLEAEAYYNFTESFAVNAGAAISDGTTLRGKRNMPTSDNAAWAGVRFSF
jgi:hypothetical protein